MIMTRRHRNQARMVLFFAAVGWLSASAHGAPRMFLVPAGTSPVTTPGEDFKVQVAAGSSITVEVFIEDTGPVGVVQYQAQLPCHASIGFAGSIPFNLTADIDMSRGDYVFAGGLSIPSVYPSCEALDPYIGGLGLSFNPVVTAPKYIGEFEYEVSIDAVGTFRVALVPDPAITWIYGASGLITFSTDGLLIQVAGRYGDISPCGGDGVINIFDLFAVLNAFGGDLECPNPGGHDCYVAGGPGCNDPKIAACVCSFDPYCCNTAWDNFCLVNGVIGCGPSIPHPCCQEGGPGCTDPIVEAAVCGVKATCCSGFWTAECVRLVTSVAGQACDDP